MTPTLVAIASLVLAMIAVRLIGELASWPRD